MGKPIGRNSPLALNGDAHGIWWEPRCAGASMAYSVNGTHFARVEPPPVQPPPPNAEPMPAPLICAIRPPPRLADAMQALRAGERIERADRGGVRISGGGRSITLFSQ